MDLEGGGKTCGFTACQPHLVSVSAMMTTLERDHPEGGGCSDRNWEMRLRRIRHRIFLDAADDVNKRRQSRATGKASTPATPRIQRHFIGGWTLDPPEMGLPVTIKVNFRGNVKRFLAGELDKLEWSSVEAWIKASFGINHFQVKYFDEDSEEICINSQDEYEEAIKSAEKQGNHLIMNVYKMKGQACSGPLKTEVKELKGDLRPAPPYPSRVKTVDKGTQVTPEREAVTAKDNKGSKAEDEPPPMWFRSYMEKFKDEVVKEVVERMCSDFSGQCCTHKSPAPPPPEASGPSCAPVMGPRPGPPAATVGPKPGPSTSTGSLGYTPNCSSCNKLTSEGAYKCSVCPSCILCEMCRHSHDPSHNLVRTKTPLSIPEHGMSGELRFPRRGDRTVRKAERQRLKAERRQLRAEVKEIKKKLRLEKRGMQWSGPSTSGRAAAPTNTASASTQAPAPLPPPAASDTASGPVPAPAPDPQASSPE